MRKISRLFNITLAAVLTLCVAAACESINSSGDDKADGGASEAEITVRQAANPNNPLDKTGAGHNEFLDYYILHADADTHLDAGRLFEIAEGFMREQHMDLDERGARNLAMFVERMSGSLAETGSPVQALINCDNIPEWLCDIVNPGPTFPYPVPVNFLADAGGTATEKTLRLIDAVKLLDNDIGHDRELSTEQRAALLNGNSTARYSAMYWHNVKYIHKGKSGYYNDKENEANALPPLRDIVKADIIGAKISGYFGVHPIIGGGLASAVAASM